MLSPSAALANAIVIVVKKRIASCVLLGVQIRRIRGTFDASVKRLILNVVTEGSWKMGGGFTSH
jgi:hypothetical protein